MVLVSRSGDEIIPSQAEGVGAWEADHAVRQNEFVFYRGAHSSM